MISGQPLELIAVLRNFSAELIRLTVVRRGQASLGRAPRRKRGLDRFSPCHSGRTFRGLWSE
jgi:hypothetical protein